MLQLAGLHITLSSFRGYFLAIKYEEHAFLYKQHFYNQRQTKTGKKSSKY